MEKSLVAALGVQIIPNSCMIDKIQNEIHIVFKTEEPRLGAEANNDAGNGSIELGFEQQLGALNISGKDQSGSIMNDITRSINSIENTLPKLVLSSGLPDDVQNACDSNNIDWWFNQTNDGFRELSDRITMTPDEQQLMRIFNPMNPNHGMILYNLPVLPLDWDESSTPLPGPIGYLSKDGTTKAFVNLYWPKENSLVGIKLLLSPMETLRDVIKPFENYITAQGNHHQKEIAFMTNVNGKL